MAIKALLPDVSTALIYGSTTLVVYLVSLVVYRRFFHPLAKIPGPFWPAVTYLYGFYHNLYRVGHFYTEIEKMHEQYGPVVRISPNEVHLSDSENYDKIYNVGGAYYKDPIYYGAWGRDTFIFTIVHNDVHRRRRAPFNPFFSRKNVLETESVVQDKVNRLCRRVREAIAGDKPINLHAGFRAVSMGVITEYAFDNCGDSLEKDNFGAEWSDSIREAGHMFWFLHQFPFMTPVLLGMPQWLTLLLSPQTGAVTETQNRSHDEVRKVMSDVKNGIKPKRTTILHEILDPNATEDNVVPDESTLVQEAFGLVTAAADNTGNALTIAAYNVVANPEIYDKLKKELRQAFPDPNAELKYVALEKLPYLTGVVKEGLRLSFGVIGRLPRVVPPGPGATFNGHYLVPGTVLSMSSWMMHRDPKVFPDPDKFEPARWLDPVNARKCEKNLVAFGRGSRICLGLTLAYAEIYCTLGTFFRRFEDLEVYETGPEDLVYDDFLSSHHPPTARKFHVVG